MVKTTTDRHPCDGPDRTRLLDEMRVTKGVARYTADFAVPTAPFPDH